MCLFFSDLGFASFVLNSLCRGRKNAKMENTDILRNIFEMIDDWFVMVQCSNVCQHWRSMMNSTGKITMFRKCEDDNHWERMPYRADWDFSVSFTCDECKRVFCEMCDHSRKCIICLRDLCEDCLDTYDWPMFKDPCTTCKAKKIFLNCTTSLLS